MAVAINVTTQDVYPPRNLISVTGLPLTSSIQIYRVVGTTRTAVRGAYSASVTDPAFIRVDAELPFGVPVSYVAVVNSSTEYSTGLATYVLDGKPVFTDAINGNAAEIVIKAWDQRNLTRRASTFQVGNRNVVVSSGTLGMYTAEIEIYVATGTISDNFFETINDPTEGVVQIRNASGTVNDYVVILSADRIAVREDLSKEEYVWRLSVAEVEPWASSLEAKSFTYQDLYNFYGPAATYQDLANDYATYLALAQGDFS